ncbi:MAG: antitoxin [Acidobacteria bacterium]|nr:MAG: antitoxin [Acidobacteriota bacterium]
MSKRLQVILDDEELRDIQRMARMKHMTVAEWVRQVLRAARRGESTGDPSRKLQAIQAAARHSFPSGDIESMLEQIEAGYGGRRR